MKKYILMFVMIIGLTFLLSGCGYTEKREYSYENKANIYSLEDNLEIKGDINGSFILGFGGINGQIDSTLYYYVMVGDDKNGYRVIKYSAEEIYIVPEDNLQQAYYIEQYEFIERNDSIAGKMPMIKNLIKKELHLPKGYIKQNYNIDMK